MDSGNSLGEAGLNTQRRNLLIIYSFIQDPKVWLGQIIHEGIHGGLNFTELLLMMTLLLLLVMVMMTTMVTMMMRMLMVMLMMTMMMMTYSDDRSPSCANRVALHNTNSVNLGYSNHTSCLSVTTPHICQ